MEWSEPFNMVTLPDKLIPREFVNLAGPAMLPHTSGILTAVLPCLAYEDEERRMVRGVSITLKWQNGGADFSCLFLFFPHSQESASLGGTGWAVWVADHYEETDEGDCWKDLCGKGLLVLDKVFRHLKLYNESPILCIVVGSGLMVLEKVLDSSHFWSYNTLLGSCLWIL